MHWACDYSICQVLPLDTYVLVCGRSVSCDDRVTLNIWKSSKLNMGLVFGHNDSKQPLAYFKVSCTYDNYNWLQLQPLPGARQGTALTLDVAGQLLPVGGKSDAVATPGGIKFDHPGAAGIEDAPLHHVRDQQHQWVLGRVEADSQCTGHQQQEQNGGVKGGEQEAPAVSTQVS